MTSPQPDEPPAAIGQTPAAPGPAAPRQPDESDVVPPAVVATPSDVPRHLDQDITWWQPSWAEAARYVGFRWIFLTPALAMIVVAAIAGLWPAFRPLIVLEIKLTILTAAISASLAAYVIRAAVKARAEPFCIYCGYNLSGLPDRYRCPECGRPYTWELIAEYRRDPHWFIERHRVHRELPGRPPPFDAGPVRRKRRARDGTE